MNSLLGHTGHQKNGRVKKKISPKVKMKSGRIEKRIRMAVPVQISALQDPKTTELAATEDVCAIGARVLTHQPKERNERLLLRSLAGNLLAQARVVYCQRLANGRFAVGLHFMGMRVKEW